MELLFLALIERTAAVVEVVEVVSSSRSSSGDCYRPIACVTREDYYIRASDSLDYNLTIVYTSTAYHALNDGVASSVDGDSDHQSSQAYSTYSKFSHN